MTEKTVTAIPTDKYKNVTPDWAWFLYFAVMFCLYGHTFIQLGIQLFIIGYVIIKQIVNYRITLKENVIRNLTFLTMWLGLLVFLLWISRYTFAEYILSNSNTVLTVFRCFAIGAAMFLYADTSEKAISILQSYALAGVVMGVAVLLTTPLSEYFQAGDEGFGTAIGQHRNQVGAVGAGMTFVCIYLKQYTNFKYGYWLSAFFAVLTLLTGSRGAIIQLLIMFFLIVIVDKNLYKMLTKIIVFVLAIAVVLLLVRNVPILYENIWVRFGDMSSTLSGEELADTSTLAREYFKEIAWIMFKQKPILGWGVDGFKSYLIKNPFYKGYFLASVYSHCNFTELAVSLGIVGLLVWYVPTFSIVAKGFKYRDSHPFMKIMFFWLISLIVLDYARIPWTAHITIYQYFLVFLLILLLMNDIKTENHNSLLNKSQ